MQSQCVLTSAGSGKLIGAQSSASRRTYPSPSFRARQALGGRRAPLRSHAGSADTPRPLIGGNSGGDVVLLPILNRTLSRREYLGVEAVALLASLGIIDAAYSGDWSRIGAITKDTELYLQQVVVFGASVHAVIGLVAAGVAVKRGSNPFLAAAKGLLCGMVGLNDVANSQAAAASDL